jgi:hypothetical protein
MQGALEAALGELVLGPALDPDDAAAVAAFFERHGVSDADAAALRAGELRRLLVYRELVRGTLRQALELAIPRSMARLGATFDEYFERFLSERGPASHYLRDVTGEFLEFCAPSWQADTRVPAYVEDLARHEALHIQIAGAARDPEAPRAPGFELEQSLRFIAAVRLVRYQFAVHRLPEAESDRTFPERAPTELLVYRSPEHDVRYLELSPFAASLLERLLSDQTLRSAVEGTARAHGVELSPSLLEATARLLADLSERGVLLGSETAKGRAVSPEPHPTKP